MELSAAQVVQATLAPAFLISGTSVFLNFSQQRLFRVVDRIRSVAKTEGHDPDEVVRLRRRVHILRNGIAFGVLTVALTVFTAILVMATEFTPNTAIAVGAPVCLALALLSLLAALGYVFADTLLSVASVEQTK
ncbi:MAG: DUF2721 domain-containing protein [Candidatus Thermoplasmatota archaeon]